MGDKYLIDFCKTDIRPAQLYLSTFATINHKHLFTDENDLRRGKMMQGGEGTSTAQYIYFEFLHDDGKTVYR